MQFKQRDIIPVVAILGIISLALGGIKLWYGLAFAIIPTGLILALRLQNRGSVKTGTTSPVAIPPVKTVVSEFELTQALGRAPAPRPVRNSDPLLLAFRTQGFNLQACVVENDTVSLTAGEILAMIGEIAKERHDDTQPITRQMPLVYDMLWEFAGEATQRYADLEMIQIHIASSVYFKVKTFHNFEI